MEKEKIDKAPGINAGAEVMRVYGTLGLAVNDLARYLRSKGIKSQANHPLGGLVSTPPLAGKAGMGWRGRHGLLITPEFGPRQRIAPIFIEGKVFEYTDNKEHTWIEEWCNSCGKCQRNCPSEAIMSQPEISIKNVSGIGATKTCIDRDKCFPYFNKTVGCSICIKVCPFSKGRKAYNRLKNIVETNRAENKVQSKKEF
jgi:epoxyqueuosine reductase QueG